MISNRQGDILLESVAGLPDEGKAIARENGRLVLARGEVTGHAHVIATPGVKLVECSDGVYVVSDVPFQMTHEEHGAIAMSPGVYHVRHQREWTDDDEPRPVYD